MFGFGLHFEVAIVRGNQMVGLDGVCKTLENSGLSRMLCYV